MVAWKDAAAGSDGPSSAEKSASSGTAPCDRVFRTVSPAECFDLLEQGGIGRVGFTAADGIMMLPVNFAVAGMAIIFRTAPDTLLALHAGARLSFEVDHFDAALGAGWSVLVQGHGHQVTDEREVKHLEDVTHLEPWAPGARDVYVRITATQISGRSIMPGRPRVRDF
jgi:nitroimidazol reductase NimA-like FMN-containing flavoprotein (pyridoxamine 5'-phosphate oxidase superfamily)